MRAYHFVNLDHGLENLRRKRLKIATIDDLNDPFEVRCVDLANANHRRDFGAFRRDVARRFGMLCFSRDWHNPVQWSHYADRHRGICLGFDLAAEIVAPVTYQDSLYTSDFIEQQMRDEASAEDMVLKILTTKFVHWQYEQEVRIFSNLEDQDPETKLYFEDFSDQVALREVVVGTECSVTRGQLAEALGDLASTVATSKARLAFRAYQVVTQNDARLWR